MVGDTAKKWWGAQVRDACHYCIKRKVKEDKEGSTRSRRTAYTCSHHPTIYVCKEGLGQCWLEHLADCGDDFVGSDNSGSDIDGGETAI